ncbi:MAG: glycosyltransferase [Verrucomicrobia bacterium]|nr:glycosyltransferase [Verrucomicrobiota bacterium]
MSDSPPLPAVFVSKIPSPYMVELFDELARQGRCVPFVIYLSGAIPDRPWDRLPIHHEHLILDATHGGWGEGMRRVLAAPLVVFSYYTHPFALIALHRRALTGGGMVYWGERPGFMRLGRLGRFMRRFLLYPLRRPQVPIWGVGEFGLEGYRREFGVARTYLNLPYASDLQPHLAVTRQKKNAGEELRFVFSGAFVPRKGVIRLAHAFVTLAQENARVRLVLLGDGPLRERLAHILEPVAGQVTWKGFVKWHDLPEAYAAGDILCLPSRYDGWGMVVVEALAAGMPVIATTQVGAARELVRPGETGWLVPPNDEAALLGALRAAASVDVALLSKMGALCRGSAAGHDVKPRAEKLAEAAEDVFRQNGIVHKRLQTRRVLPRRVVLLANYLPDKQFSMQRYAALLERGLVSEGLDVTTIRPPVLAGRLLSAFRVFHKPLGFIDKFIFFPFALRVLSMKRSVRDSELVHLLDQGNGVYLQALAGVRHLVTCHDLIAAKAGSGRSASLLSAGLVGKESAYQKMNLDALSKAAWYACISEATREDCVQVLRVPRERCEVIYNPLDPFFLQPAGGLPDDFPPRYFIHVGNSSWYKNRPGLFRIYAELRKLGCEMPLVLMGDAVTAEEKKWMRRLEIEPHVIIVVQPSDAAIRAAYAHAAALIFPSLEEGFGWPVLEAMAQGCPVFTTHFRPMTEAGGGAAFYIDPSAPSAAAAEIILQLGKGGRDAASVAARKEHAAGFTMERFIKGYLDLYEKIMASKIAE